MPPAGSTERPRRDFAGRNRDDRLNCLHVLSGRCTWTEALLDADNVDTDDFTFFSAASAAPAFRPIQPALTEDCVTAYIERCHSERSEESPRIDAETPFASFRVTGPLDASASHVDHDLIALAVPNCRAQADDSSAGRPGAS